MGLAKDSRSNTKAVGKSRLAAHVPSKTAMPRSSSVGKQQTSKFVQPAPGAIITPSHHPAQPPLPARSPLRPGNVSPSPTKSVTFPPSSDTLLIAINRVDSNSGMFRHRSFGSISGVLDSLHLGGPQDQPQDSLSDKVELISPDSPLALSVVEDEAASSSGSSLDSEPPPQPKLPKRSHALLELLSSERAYASDLAFIRDVHIPLAMGQSGAFQLPPDTPPASSISSGRTASSLSDSSTLCSAPPMTREDTKVIFGNIAELAVFSDAFTERLEEALGAVLEEGQRQDHVGELFLEIIPALEPLYTTYITRHPAALEHLNSLPQTPALNAYLSQTRSLASSLTHAWDLPSLLIKPVQRLLKYSLLLSAIIEETADTHSDVENLKLAKKKMEEVAMGVNEGRRRREVVKEVLTRSGGEGLKKKVTAVGVATSVNLQRMGSMRKHKPKGGNEEALQVEQMEKELQGSIRFMREFYKHALDWSKTVAVLQNALRLWALGFSRVIGLSDDIQSEAFDAFFFILDQSLLPLCKNLDDVLRSKVLLDLTRLLDSTQAPLRLLEAMESFEPLHYALLNINVSRTRPPPALLEASQSYVALRGQLCAELPRYLYLLRKGLASCIVHLSVIQIEFWREVQGRWCDLWDSLKVDGEINAGVAETERVWWERWCDVEEHLNAVNILNRKRALSDVPTEHLGIPAPSPLRSDVVATMLSSLETPKPGRTPAVVNMLSALEPTVSHPKLSPSPSSRLATLKYTNASDDPQYIGRGSRPNSGRKDSEPEEWGQALYSTHVSDSVPSSRTAPSGPRGMPPSPSVWSTASSTAPTLCENPRGRSPRRPTLRQKISKTLRPGSRNNSPSIRSLYSPDSHNTYTRGSSGSADYPNSPSAHWHARWQHATARYVCRVVHPCQPPPGTTYHDLPFFTLEPDRLFDVLKEFGHPSTHIDIPLYVDDGEDCLMLVRDEYGEIGWALASFLIPVA